MCVEHTCKQQRCRCTVAHMESLKDPLLKPCILETADACPKVVAALRLHRYASAESARTGRFLRVQGRTIAMGDVVLYRGSGHNDIRVGEVYFHASLGGELLDCITRIEPVEKRLWLAKMLPPSPPHACCGPSFLPQRRSEKQQPS